MEYEPILDDNKLSGCADKIVQHDALIEDEPIADDPNADAIKDDPNINADENMKEDVDRRD